MTIWLDAQLSPALARWISGHFPNVNAVAVREVGLRDAEDVVIFEAARRAGVTLMTKDQDFVTLLGRLGPPPKVIWIRSGNTSNVRMQQVLSQTLASALGILDAGDTLVEIR